EPLAGDRPRFPDRRHGRERHVARGLDARTADRCGGPAVSPITDDGTVHQGDRPPTPLLDVERLTVTVGPAERPRTLVGEVSFHLDRGQTLGIVGESGSGKSLTARSIIGLLPAGLRADGTVMFDGRQLIGASGRTWRAMRGSRISLLLQDP